MTASAAKTAGPSKIQQVSATRSNPPVAAGRIEELIRSGQTAVVEAGQSDPAKLQQARDLFSQALALDGMNASAHHGIAIVADLQQDWQTAETHYKQALRSRQQDPSLLNDIGYSYLLQDRYHEASQYLNQALQHAPKHERAHINLALLSLKRGDRQGAQARLSAIQSPTVAQTTLAHLEADLQSSRGNASNGQQPQQWPTNTSAQALANAASAQPIVDNRPVHVYPPGTKLENESVAAVPQNSPQGQPYYPSPSGNESGQINPEMNPPAASVYPNADGVQPRVAARYGQPNQTGPANRYSTGNVVAPNPMAQPANGYGNQMAQQPAYQPYPNNLPNGPQSGNQFQPQPQPGTSFAPQQPPAHANYPAGGGQAGQAPMAGLNVGPGALFPIGLQNVQPQQYQNYNQPVHGTNPVAGVPQGGQFPVSGQQPPVPQQQQNPSFSVMPTQSSSAHLNEANSAAANQQFPNPQMPNYSVPAANPTNYQYNTMPASSSQPLPGYGAPAGVPNTNMGYGQGQLNPQGVPSGQPYQTAAAPSPGMQYVGSAPTMQQPGVQPQPPAGRSPMSEYERQLQALDSQYHRTIQQMDGNGAGLAPAPAAAQYR